jgi:hypothetical protein
LRANTSLNCSDCFFSLDSYQSKPLDSSPPARPTLIGTSFSDQPRHSAIPTLADFMFVVVERRNGVRSGDGSKLEKDCFQMEVPIELSGSDGEEQVSTAIDGSNHGSNDDFVDDTDDTQLPSVKQSPNVRCIDGDSHETDANEEGDVHRSNMICFYVVASS